MILNAEPALTMDPLTVSPGVRRSAILFFRKMVRGLGLSSHKEPQRPKIPHPVENLIFHNFAIYEIYRGQPGRQYISMADVEVLRKLSFRELETGSCEYRFELKAAPDPIWQFFFKRLSREVAVRFENRTMVLCCLPSQLETNYERLRDAIVMANAWHREEREELLVKINVQIEALQAAQEAEENRRFGLQRQFDGLDI
jgi:hypothetical protein